MARRNAAAIREIVSLEDGVATCAEESEHPDEWDGRVASWSMIERGGGSLFDFSGYGRHASISGATWIDCPYGRALSFDGVNDFASAGTHSFGNTDMSLEMWIKPIASANSYVFGGYTTPGPAVQFTVGVGVANKVNMYTNSGGVRISSTTTVTDGNFHHVVWRDIGSTMYIAVDGVVEASGAAGSVSYNSWKLTLGYKGDNVAFYNGEIAACSLYLRGLSDAEIKSHYQRGPNSYLTPRHRRSAFAVTASAYNRRRRLLTSCR